MDYARSLELFDKLLTEEGDDCDGGYDAVKTRLSPPYEILAYKAAIYTKGDNGVVKNTEMAGG